MKKSYKESIMTIVKLVVVLSTALATLYIYFEATKNGLFGGNFNIATGYYGRNPHWLPDGNSTEINDLYDQHKDNEAMFAYLAYKTACRKLSLLQGYASRTFGNIHFTAAGLEGDVVNVIFRETEVLGTPKVCANQPVNYTQESYVMMTALRGATTAVEDIMKNAIMFADRIVSDSEGTRVYRGRNPVISANEASATWGTRSNPYTAVQRTYADGDIREKSDFIVSYDNIIKDTVKVDKVSGFRGAFRYDIEFNLDVSDNSPSGAVYFEAEGIKRQVGSALNSLDFTNLKITMSIYENGYMTAWGTDQTWNAVFSMWIVHLEGTARMTASELISYEFSV
jgi:hypothetical protein